MKSQQKIHSKSHSNPLSHFKIPDKPPKIYYQSTINPIISHKNPLNPRSPMVFSTSQLRDLHPGDRLTRSYAASGGPPGASRGVASTCRKIWGIMG
jgi:hypothetical protein